MATIMCCAGGLLLGLPVLAWSPVEPSASASASASTSTCPAATVPGSATAPHPMPSAACALAYLDALCTHQPGNDVTEPLANYLGVHPLNVRKGLGRTNVLNRHASASWCTLAAPGRQQAMAIAMTPKKGQDPVKASANRQHLEFTMADANGTINAAGYAMAMEQRRKLVRNGVAGETEAPTLVASRSAQPAHAQETGRVAPLLAGLPSSASGWTNLTGYIHPVGRINDLLIDTGGTTSSRTMWAGTDGGGIWKTTNGGSSWSPVNDFNGSLSIGKILRSPRNTQEMYASTNPYGSHTYSPFGVLKSNDGGVTWSQLTGTNPATNSAWQYVTHMAIHPSGVADQDVLLVATTSGAYQSSDSGASWSKISAGTTTASAVAFHPADGNRRAYALNDGTLSITANGDWASATTQTLMAGTTRAYTKFAFAATDANVVYAMLSDASGHTNLMRSSNAGSTWTALTPPDNFYFNNGYLYYVGGLWVDPTNANRIATFEGWVATTPNATTATASSGWAQSPIGWVDFHGAVADPDYNGTSNKIIYLMDDGGLYKFNDVDTLSGGSFLATGMTITETYSVSGRGGNIVFGAQDVGPRVLRSLPPSDSTERWRFVGNPAQCSGCSWIGDGATTAAAHDNAAVLYGSRQYLDLFRSTDGGVTGTALCGSATTAITEGRCGGNYNAAFIAPFVLDPNNSATMLAGGRSLWRSNNVATGTPTWGTIHTGSTSSVSAIAIAATDSNTIWIAYQHGSVYKTTNGLSNTPTWTQVTNVPQGSKLKIYIDRSNSSKVYLGLAGFSGSTLYATSDGGGTWGSVSGLPAASVMAMEQHPANAAWLYVVTDRKPHFLRNTAA